MVVRVKIVASCPIMSPVGAQVIQSTLLLAKGGREGVASNNNLGIYVACTNSYSFTWIIYRGFSRCISWGTVGALVGAAVVVFGASVDGSVGALVGAAVVLATG